jgi:hypothetical protein
MRSNAVIQRKSRFLFALLLVLPAIASRAVAEDAQSLDTVEPVDITRFPQPRPYNDRPPLPVHMLPRDVVEPPRTVRAHQWRSPYCTHWTDGGEFCQRDKADQRATCRRLDAAIARPVLHPIACVEADLTRLAQVCFKGFLSDPGTHVPGWGPSERRLRPGFARMD